jgi:hypothetical protein
MIGQSPLIVPSRKGVPDEQLTCPTQEDKQRILRRKMRVYAVASWSARSRPGAASLIRKTNRKAPVM